MSNPPPFPCSGPERDRHIDESVLLGWLSETSADATEIGKTPALDTDLGIPAIDQQHRRLGQLLVGLRHHAERQDRAGLQSAIDALARFSARHFATEEQLMAAAYYPFLPQHREEHQRLLASLDQLRGQNLEGLDLGEGIAELEYGFAHHFLQQDRHYAPYLRQSPKRGWMIRMCQALLRRETPA
jgi:hemerythrin